MYTYTIYTPRVPTPPPVSSVPQGASVTPAIASGFSSTPLGRSAIWMFKVSTAAVGLAVGTSDRMHKYAEYGIDATVSKAKGIIKVIARDEREHVKELDPLADSVQPKKAPVAPAPLNKQPATKKQVVKHSYKLNAYPASPKVAAAAKQPELTAAEQQLLRGEQEGQHWGEYINASSLRSDKKWFGKVLIDGVITSSATVATYKDLVLHVHFTSRKGAALPDQTEVIPFLSPGKSVRVHLKLKMPADTDSVIYKITSANYLLAPR